MHLRKYDKQSDESQLMAIIKDENGWDYADEAMSEQYKRALENSITYVAFYEETLCGYSRSIDDGGFYIYVCDLLVKPAFRGMDTGRKLMECICNDYPDHEVFVMSDVDGYYEKIGYERIGSVFKVPGQHK